MGPGDQRYSNSEAEDRDLTRKMSAKYGIDAVKPLIIMLTCSITPNREIFQALLHL